MVAQLESLDIYEAIESIQAVTNHLKAPTLTLHDYGLDEYRGLVDEALQLIYSQHHRIISRLYPAATIRVSVDQLRDGPLNEHLSRLAHIAGGAMTAGKEQVRNAITAVLQLPLYTSTC